MARTKRYVLKMVEENAGEGLEQPSQIAAAAESIEVDGIAAAPVNRIVTEPMPPTCRPIV